MSKVLITGASGSIGNALATALKNDGSVTVERSNSQARIQQDDYFEGISNPSEIDTLYHLAAISFVPKSWEKPADFIEVNVLGTTKALEFCRKHNINFVYISSYAYGIPTYLPIDEKHPVSAVNPYGLSKIMAEELCEFYGTNFNVNYTIIRPFNIYGSLQNKALLIPEIIEQIIEGKEIKVKDLTPRRDYLFQDDLIDFLVKIKSKSSNEVYNLGSGKSYSVEEIIATCQAVFETALPVHSAKIERPNEIPETRCDWKKANAHYGWQPKISLAAGIRRMKNQLLPNS